MELSHHEDGGVKVVRKVADQSFNYFSFVQNEPLTDPCLFKVDVLNVYESDRFVDVGICPKSKYDQIKNGYINSFNSGGISFCGYSKGGGLNGKMPTSSSSSPDGMKPGSHFYFRYEPGVSIRFYDDDDKIDLKLDMTGKTEEYYLFGVCYHP